MRQLSIVLLTVACAVVAAGTSTDADREAIRQAVSRQGPKLLEGTCVANGSVIPAGGAGGAWTEASRPFVLVHSVQFPAEDRAVVYATRRQVGVMSACANPVLFRLEKNDDDWRITSFRLYPAWPLRYYRYVI